MNMKKKYERLSRLRSGPALRSMVRENHVRIEDLIAPLFVHHGKCVRHPISSMPGQEQISVDLLGDKARRIYDLGIKAVLLFGIPARKDSLGSDSFCDTGIIQQAVRELKYQIPDLLVITDVCFCEYTDHGHCGILDEDGKIDQAASLENLTKQALSHAHAGADMLAPSGMIDGAVGTIRTALDNEGFDSLPIMSYAAKYASSFYGPFREAAEGAPKSGDRRSHQMDPANSEEALREVERDISEGADIVMVKPGLAYLDIIRQVKDTFKIPTAAYNVSGEYAMVKAAVEKGWIDEQSVVMEILTGFKRSGADLIITYHAEEVVGNKWV